MTTLGDVNQETHFSVLLSSTRRGARLARLIAVAQLCSWDVPLAASEDAALVVAELAANAATHGRVPGRNFRLELRMSDDGTLRIEVADTRGDAHPPAEPPEAADDAESGRGLLLVEALASRWGVLPGPFPRKTVWAEVALGKSPSSPSSPPSPSTLTKDQEPPCLSGRAGAAPRS
ncbi:ATP-binding protein [Streptomyces sp. NBC_01186]|uniref:ATP-binding protein n=1 Tax=unclassified Streptomyces TaxID=2593676 RepID=UPI002DD8D268|nr:MULTISPECIES: ATP-binding protein [unclassified Streptomyces]WSB81546.1 ATP-binding protein [Streptomyces sp. NBC_01775]WSS17699.1 ATP-binding protein [Streptomyces sp. NBC_01186]